MPAQGRRRLVSTDRGHHKRRQVFTGQRLLDPTLQAAAREAFLACRVCQALERAQRGLRFAQGDRHAAFLALQQCLALNHDQRAVQFADGGVHPCRAHGAQLAGQPLHRAAPRRHLQRLFRSGVAERQRDQAGVAGAVQLQLQLRAPEPAIAYQRPLRWPVATLAVIERLVQGTQPIQARREHALVGAVPRRGPVQQRHLARLTDQQAKPHQTQIAALALGVPAPGQRARRHRRDVGIEVRGVEGDHVGRQLEPGHRRVRDRHLRLLQLARADLLRHPMRRLPAERRARQARDTRHARIQKVRQVTLRSRRARPLDGDSDGHLADRRAPLGPKAAARPVDVCDQIQLLRDPGQRADVPHRARAHRTRGTEIDDRWRSRRPQHHLARDRPTASRVPHRLGRDPVAVAIHLAFEHMHVLSCSTYPRPRHGPPPPALFRPLLPKMGRRSLQICEGRARALYAPYFPAAPPSAGRRSTPPSSMFSF